MLTGIRVLTLLELAFWFVRFFSRRCFRSSKTETEQQALPSTQNNEEFNALKEENAAMKREISVIKEMIFWQSKSPGKKGKVNNWPSIMTR